MPPSESFSITLGDVQYYYSAHDGVELRSPLSRRNGSSYDPSRVVTFGTLMCGYREKNQCAHLYYKNGRSGGRRGDRCVFSVRVRLYRLREAQAVLFIFVFFLSYFHYSLHHVAFKWVSEESCSLPWATQLINSTPRTHKDRLPQKHNV